MKISDDLYTELELKYQTRNFTEETLDTAVQLIATVFKEWKVLEIEEFSATQLKMLSSTVEVLDYFNKFDDSIALKLSNEDIKKGDIYNWISGLGRKLWATQDLAILPDNLDEIEVFLERSRFIAAVVFSEMYRLNKPICVDQMYCQIRELKKFTTVLTEMDNSGTVLLRYIDNLSYHYFLHGKVCRQFKYYTFAKEAFEKSTVCLMELAQKYAEFEVDNNEKYHFQSKMMRIGVVNLAQASMYLSWGKISRSDHHISAALKLLGRNDLASRQDAQGIKGAILRIKAANDKTLLEDAIKLLEKSYRFFLSGQKMPRRAIRNLVALETALIIHGSLNKAVKLLKDLLLKELSATKQKEFNKILKNPHWLAQLHIIISRIARKDVSDKYVEDLQVLADKLISHSNPRISDSFGCIPKSINSSINLAVFEAKEALRIAPSGTRIEFDAWWSLGEAHIKLKNYIEAKRCYHTVLDLCILKNEEDKESSNKVLPLIAGCYLHLGTIAIQQRQLDEAERLLAEFDKLGNIEHQLINELAAEVRADYKTLAANQIVIRFDSDGKNWSMADFEMELKKQIAVRFNVKNMPLKDFKNKFGRGKAFYYELKKMSKQGSL